MRLVSWWKSDYGVRGVRVIWGWFRWWWFVFGLSEVRRIWGSKNLGVLSGVKSVDGAWKQALEVFEFLVSFRNFGWRGLFPMAIRSPRGRLSSVYVYWSFIFISMLSMELRTAAYRMMTFYPKNTVPNFFCFHSATVFYDRSSGPSFSFQYYPWKHEVVDSRCPHSDESLS